MNDEIIIAAVIMFELFSKFNRARKKETHTSNIK